MKELPATMGATVWLRKGKVMVTGARYLWPQLTQERDTTTSSGLFLWSKLDESALGAVVRGQLETCRRVLTFDGPDDPREEVQQFEARLCGHLNLKSPRGMYPGMKQVNIFRTPPHRFSFHPMKNRGRGFFQEFSDLWPDKQPFGIPFDASDAEIGAATRLAMEKSI